MVGQAELLEQLVENGLKGVGEASRYIINDIAVNVAVESSAESRFLLRMLEPWESRGSSAAVMEEWAVSFASSEEGCEELRGQIFAEELGATSSVKRWGGDSVHWRKEWPSSVIAVVHDIPFRGATICLPSKRKIHCVFHDKLAVPHLEHVVKYPCRVRGWGYGRWECHAASVLRNGVATLVVGPRRSGKTTTSLALVSRGGEYIGNDLCAVRVDASGTLLVNPIPHMLRLAPENVKPYPAFDGWVRAADGGNLDYTRGMVLEGGKYEIYDPHLNKAFGLRPGGQARVVETIVFAKGETGHRTPACRELSRRETVARLAQLISHDHPLPEWLFHSSQQGDHVDEVELSERIYSELLGVEFCFSFSDNAACDALCDLLWT